VVGTGVIGRSWAIVFARAGCRARLYDRDVQQAEKAAELLLPWKTQISVHTDLASALEGVGYVQENSPESLEIKRQVFRDLDAAADPAAILASSTSAFDMSRIADGLPGARRCIIAHPVNPPHVIPAVEVLSGTATDPDVVERTCAFLASVGQTPVRMHKYIHGFLLNRMQFALVREAISLFEQGVADLDDIDAVIRDGLGLRWALMGPFAVANTNADGGIRQYLTGHEQWLMELMDGLGGTPRVDAGLIARLGDAIDQAPGGARRQELRVWRDRMIARINELKRKEPSPR
jgi:3-hydroxyacyl-CoA dehydrogenase